MKKWSLLLVIAINGLLPVCGQDVWAPKADFFEARAGAASFSINDKIYVATGNEKADLWEYDPYTNVWSRKADLPSAGRSFATGFSIGNKGYIVGGVRLASPVNSTVDLLMTDVWEYDPALNSWTKKADFAGGRRARAVAFTWNGKAYVGSGQNAPGPIMSQVYPNRVTSDFWAFDPVLNSWTRIADIPMRRMNAIAFSDGQGKGFVGTGFYNTYSTNSGLDRNNIFPGDNLQDLWAYDVASNKWERKSNFPGGKRMGMAAYQIGDMVYAVGGAEVAGSKYWLSAGDISSKEVWAYNISTNTWAQKADFPDTARRYAYAAAISGSAYVGGGASAGLWAIPFAIMSPLPLKLVSFSGQMADDKTRLQWKIIQGENLDRFEIEGSTDGIVFLKSGTVMASHNTEYHFESASSGDRNISYYRLKMIMADNQFSYSKTIKLAATGNQTNLRAVFYPSPLKGDNGFITVTSGKTQRLQVVVSDIQGHQLITQEITVFPGSNIVSLNLQRIGAGNYFIRVIDERKSSVSIQFMKQ